MIRTQPRQPPAAESLLKKRLSSQTQGTPAENLGPCERGPPRTSQQAKTIGDKQHQISTGDLPTLQLQDISSTSANLSSSTNVSEKQIDENLLLQKRYSTDSNGSKGSEFQETLTFSEPHQFKKVKMNPIYTSKEDKTIIQNERKYSDCPSQSTCCTGSPQYLSSDQEFRRQTSKSIEDNFTSCEYTFQSYEQNLQFTSNEQIFQQQQQQCANQIIKEEEIEDEKSNENDDSFEFLSPIHNKKSHQKDLTEEFLNLIQKFYAKSIDQFLNVEDELQLFDLKCFMNHRFQCNLQTLRHPIQRSEYWCVQCSVLLNKAQDYAKQNGGQVCNLIFAPELQMKCCRGHEWSVSSKSYQSKWCNSCKRILKEEFKQYLKEEEFRKQKEYEQKQEEMYNDAKKKYLDSIYYQESYQQKVVSAAKGVEKEVEKIAQKQAKEYMNQKDFNGNATYAQIKDMYKILLFPEQILQLYFSNISKEELKQEYKNYAKLIHPDKLRHPKAAQAFQKLKHFYDQACAGSNI